MSYDPKPPDTDPMKLPPSIGGLMEKLAESIHDVWAAGRLKEGWTYGPKRDDAAKTHPGLVAYGELTESEKDYDRKTATATLLFILTLGFEIRGPK